MLGYEEMWTSLGCLVFVVFVMAMLWKKDVEKEHSLFRGGI